MAPKKKAQKKATKKNVVKKSVKKTPTKKILPKVNSVGITPLGDRVLIEEVEVVQENRTASGIYIPESVKEEQKESKRGKVIAVGEGRFENGKRVPVSVKVGESIIYSWGDDITVKGKNYTLVSEGNVSAIIK